jgi:hypothetical protein
MLWPSHYIFPIELRFRDAIQIKNGIASAEQVCPRVCHPGRDGEIGKRCAPD